MPGAEERRALSAAFEPIATRVIEVDAPGISSPKLTSFPYERLRRPITRSNRSELATRGLRSSSLTWRKSRSGRATAWPCRTAVVLPVAGCHVSGRAPRRRPVAAMTNRRRSWTYALSAGRSDRRDERR